MGLSHSFFLFDVNGKYSIDLNGFRVYMVCKCSYWKKQFELTMFYFTLNIKSHCGNGFCF